MSYISPEFAFLAVLFFPLYWALSRWHRWQQLLLLLSSYGLYASWSWSMACLLALYSLALWLLGMGLQTAAQAYRKHLLTVGLVAVTVFLVAAKYFNYLTELLAPLMGWLGWVHAPLQAQWAVPVGVSFFTFQAVTYLVSVYRGHLLAQSLPRVMLYLSFWPTLFAGPIFRAESFFAQLAPASWTGQPLQGARAIYLILLGLAQKLVLASWLATQFVDPVFKYPDSQAGLSVLCGVVAYTLQILFDFAGYTSVVTGLALLLGFTLPENFRQPYLALNMREFWQRWHISLSSFITHYIYVPLGGNQKGFVRTQINVIVAMLISGLWHGAATAFVVWGLLHALAIVWLNVREKYRMPALPPSWAHVLTFLFVVMTWVFFRCASGGGDAGDALQVFRSLWQGGGATWWIPVPQIMPVLGLLFLTIAIFPLSRHAQALEGWVCQQLTSLPFWAVTGCMVMSVWGSIALGPSGVPSFIYYQF